MDSMRVTKKKSLHIARETSFVNSMPFAKKMNLIGFLDSSRIIAAMIFYLHCAISVSWSLITEFEL